MSPKDSVAAPRSHSYHTVLWTLAVLLAFIAGSLWSRGSGLQLDKLALAQNAPVAGARGIYAFTGQLDANRAGLFMLDIEQGTVWCYEIENAGGVRKLKLAAARSWIYDRYLQDFNCLEPSFRTVQDLVAKQRTQPDDDKNKPGTDSNHAKPEPARTP